MSLLDNKIGDEGAKALANNTSLTLLDLASSQISHEGAKALANNTSLTSLDLSGNGLGNRGLCAFSEALKGKKNQRLLILKLPMPLSYDIEEALSHNKSQNLPPA